MRRPSLVACVFLLLNACSTTPHLTNRAQNYNDAVEVDANIGVLKNAVRASKRLPLTYTSIQNLQYIGKVSGGVDPNFKFGDGENVLPVDVSFGANDQATINVNRLIGEKFYGDITKAISSTEFLDYWEQGWPRDLLLIWLAEYVEVRCDYFYHIADRLAAANAPLVSSQTGTKVGTPAEPDRSRRQIAPTTGADSFVHTCDAEGIETNKSRYVRFVNEPDEPKEFLAFVALANIIREAKYTIKTTKPDRKSDPVSPLMTTAEYIKFIEHLPDESVLGQKGYVLQTTAKKGVEYYQIHKKRSGTKKISFEDLCPKAETDKEDSQTQIDSANHEISAFVEESIFGFLSDDVSFDFPVAELSAEEGKETKDSKKQRKQKKPPCVQSTLRSPDAAVYYLGELLRAQRNEGGKYNPHCGPKSRGARLRLHARGCSFTRNESELEDAIEGKKKGDVLFYLNHSTIAPFPFVRRNGTLGNFEFRYLGDLYAVPEDPTYRGRTMQAVALMLQIIGRRQAEAETESGTILLQSF